MEEKNDYIEKLIEKLATVGDDELKEMIFRLIEERNYLINSANVDPLSGLNNRRIVDKIRKYEFVSMIDIDNFKTINDTFGHDVGDKVIRIVGSILKANSRSDDFVIRYGGDEFLVIFNGGNLKVVNERMNKIREEIKEKIKIPDYDVTISIGIAHYEYNTSIYDTIKKADEMMYYSKHSGKDTISSYKNDTNRTR